MNVLVIRFGRVGDLLVVTPALRALRKAVGGGTIHVLSSATGVATLATNRNVDALHALTWRRVPALINPERARLIRRLRRVQFDAVFLLETAERYRKLARAVRAAQVFTFARADESADAHHARREDKHEVEHFADVLRLAGIDMTSTYYDFPVNAEARAQAAALLAAKGIRPGARLVGVHAGHFVRRRRATPHPKEWPTERYVEVIRALADRGADAVVLTGSAAERELNARILRALPAGLAINLAGATNLETLGAVIEQCALFIAPDTGPAHLAAALQTPLVALFGPKSPQIMGPCGDDARIRRLYPPASEATYEERRGYHPRMWQIGVDDVLAAADQLHTLGQR